MFQRSCTPKSLSKELQNDEMEAPKKWCISPEERKKSIDELRLV